MARTRTLHVVTNSEIATFDTCRARHGFAYIDLLRPLVRALPLTWGDLYHHGADAGWMAAWMADEASTKARKVAAQAAAPLMIGERAQEYIKTLESESFPDGVDVQALCEETEQAARVANWAVAHYFEQAEADLAMVPLMVEGKYETQIPNAGGYGGMLVSAGKMDLVLWDRELGRIVVQDHKGIGGDVHGVEKRVLLDTQLVGYVCAVKTMIGQLELDKFSSRATFLERLATTPAARNLIAKNLEQLKAATVGSIGYNVVRRRMPEQPNINLLKKSQVITERHRELLARQEATGEPQGEVSAAKVDTLASVYAAALELQILDRELPTNEKQMALLENLKQRGDTYFTQIEHFKDAAAIERWRGELWVKARRLREAERNPAERTRNPLACTLPTSPACPYATICLSPDDPVARKQFRIAKSKHEELEDGNSGAAEQQQEEGEVERF